MRIEETETRLRPALLESTPKRGAGPQKLKCELKDFQRYRHRENMSDYPKNAIAPRFGVLSYPSGSSRRSIFTIRLWTFPPQTYQVHIP
jgi:hypothetical protein